MPKFHQLHSNFQCLSSMSTALSKMASPTTVHVCTKVMHAGDQDGWMGRNVNPGALGGYFSWQSCQRDFGGDDAHKSSKISYNKVSLF